MVLNRSLSVRMTCLGLAIASLTACDGGKNNNTTTSVVSTTSSSFASSSTASTTVDYSKLKVAPQTEQPLGLVSGDALANHIKNGLRLQVRGSNRVYASLPSPVSAPSNEAATDNSAGGKAADAGFSATNVHVAGVDEADFAKYDGKHWFVAAYPTYEPYNVDNSPRINVVATNPVTPSAEVIAQIKLNAKWGGVGEMYLVDGGEGKGAKAVAALQNQWGNVYPMMPGIGFPMMNIAIAEPAMTRPAIVSDALIYPYPVNSQVRVDLFDVQNPAAPESAWNIQLDGSLVDSRKVDNVLYLVTRFDPWLKTLAREQQQGDANRDTNETKLAAIALESLMPHYHINGVDKGALSEGCYLQASADKNVGYASLVNVTAIDLASQKVVSSRCINGAIESLSMSRESLYLTGTVFDGNWQRSKTVIHKFALSTAGASYKATGSVDGYIGHSADPAFKLNEHKGDLRVVTTQREPLTGAMSHHLWVLEDSGNALKTIAQLPNKERPAAIGKPGEDIYSVRFEGDSGYIVTFRRTDPLYKLDFSDRLDPKVTGELEIPGFATYMHPVGDNYLFAIGQDADANGRVQGLKVALMDVSGDAPKEVETILLGTQGSSSEALNNLKALSFLQTSDDQLRVAMPVNIYQNNNDNHWGGWQYTGLELFEINGITTASASLSHQGVIVAEEASSTKNYASGNGNDRGILHGDAVFFAHANGIWAANWQAPKEAVGPVMAPPVACTLDLRPAFALTLNTPNGSASAAKVVAVSGNEVFELSAQGGSGQTSTYTGPFEREGYYYVQATLKGFSPASTEVVVLKDSCHVLTEKTALTLKPFDGNCGAVVTDAVVVNVGNYSGGNACDAQVTVIQGDKRIPLRLVSGVTELSGEDVVTENVVTGANAFAAADRAIPFIQACRFSGAANMSGAISIEVQSGKQQVVREGLFIKAKDACAPEPIEQYFYF